MRYIGITIISFLLLTMGYVYIDFRQEKMKKSAFLLTEILCALALIGTFLLTFFD